MSSRQSEGIDTYVDGAAMSAANDGVRARANAHARLSDAAEDDDNADQISTNSKRPKGGIRGNKGARLLLYDFC